MDNIDWSTSFKLSAITCGNFCCLMITSSRLETEGPWVRASPASLRCSPWARHIYPSLVLVQPRKTRPCLTERLLMGRKESNQTNKTNLILLVATFVALPSHQHHGRQQWKTLILSINVDEKKLETFHLSSFVTRLATNGNLSPNWRQMAIQNTVSSNFFICIFVNY